MTVAVLRNTITRIPHAKTRLVSDRELGLPLIMFKSKAGKQSLFTVMVIGNAKICTVWADCRVCSVKPGSAGTVHCASYGYGSKSECAE